MQLTGNRQPGREAGPDWFSTGYPMTIRALCGVARVLAILLDSSFFCEKACVRTLQGVSCSAPIRRSAAVTFRSDYSLPSSATSAEKVYSTSTDRLPSLRAAADGYSRKDLVGSKVDHTKRRRTAWAMRHRPRRWTGRIARHSDVAVLFNGAGLRDALRPGGLDF